MQNQTLDSVSRLAIVFLMLDTGVSTYGLESVLEVSGARAWLKEDLATPTLDEEGGSGVGTGGTLPTFTSARYFNTSLSSQ